MSIKLPERPTEAALPPGLVAVDTQWGVRYAGHRHGEQLSVVAVDECKDRLAALALVAALLFCGNTEAVPVKRVGDGQWVPDELFIHGWDFAVKMRTSEVAALFRVEARTVERWADAGKLAVIWTAGLTSHGHRRFSRQQVEHILAGGGW